ncbi:MAG: flagellar motor protein MotB [Pseudomonadota bacterium]
MTDKSNQPIIVKRKKVVAGDGHHGGAWKVAYADFVTAMMAFFLLMWLLNATTEEQRKGLADYFKPTIPVHRTSGGGDGPLGGDSAFAEQVMVQNGTGATRETPSSEDKARGIEGSTETQDENDSLTAVDTELLSISGESDVEDTIHEHIRTVVTDEGLIIELFELPGKRDNNKSDRTRQC